MQRAREGELRREIGRDRDKQTKPFNCKFVYSPKTLQELKNKQASISYSDSVKMQCTLWYMHIIVTDILQELRKYCLCIIPCSTSL